MESIQPVTKTLLFLTVGITVLSLLQIIPISKLYYIKETTYLLKTPWRFFTSFFLLSASEPMGAVMRLYSLYSHSNDLETLYFMRVSQYVYFLLFNCIAVVLMTFYFPDFAVWSLEPALQMALSYCWSNVNYNKQVRYFGVIPLTAKYVYLVDLILNYLFSGGAFIPASGILGCASAYLYHCISTGSYGPFYGFIKFKLLNQVEKPYIKVKSNTLNGDVKYTNIPNPNFQHGQNSNYGYGGGSPLIPTWFSKLYAFVLRNLNNATKNPKPAKTRGVGKRLGALSNTSRQSSTTRNLRDQTSTATTSARFGGEGRRLGG